MHERTTQPKTAYTCLFPFGGIGAGALGFLQAQHPDARFVSLGGIDFDELACRDFRMLTGTESWCMDVTKIAPQQLRDRFGVEPPDVVFLSPPCKGSSGLLSKKAAESEKYQAMNRLAYVWIVAMLAAWGDKRPRLILFENVPRITSRAGKMLAEVRDLLTEAGYLIHEGFHDCGEVGGLAQHRRRYLMIARHKSVQHLLYQPPRQRVKGCGEVLGQLPLPGDPAAGPMHQLPKISLLNQIRLALIPAGGDWRDLPGVLTHGQARGEVWKRHRVETWPEPVGAVAGSGSNGVSNVADPRLALAPSWRNVMAVTAWQDTARTVTSQSGRVEHSSGGGVADPRLPLACLGANTHHSLYQIAGWSQPAATVTSATRPGQGGLSVADPRVGAFHTSYGVQAWSAPAGTVTGAAAVSSGSFSVADPRLALGYATRPGTMGVRGWATPSTAVTGQSGRMGHCSGGLVADPRLPLGCEPRAGAYGVDNWAAPASAVTGSANLDNGTFAVADPRLALLVPRAYDHAYRSLAWSQPSYTIAGKTSTGCGAYAVADPRWWQLVGFSADNPERHWNKYRVGSWSSPAGSVIGAVQIGSGAPAVADPRADAMPEHLAHYQVLTWLEATALLELPSIDPKKPAPWPLLIVAADGTWHRPMTTLELAVLQGLPATVEGRPLVLSGGSSLQREHIGNAVPVGAAKAIAEEMLKTLVAADRDEMFLSSSAVWVAPEQRADAPGVRQGHLAVNPW